MSAKYQVSESKAVVDHNASTLEPLILPCKRSPCAALWHCHIAVVGLAVQPFHHAMFELADVCTNTTELGEYLRFLQEVI
jgi:hypothetical protein